MYNDDNYDDDMFDDYDEMFDYMLDLKSMEKINAALKNLVVYSSRIYDLTVEEMYRLESLRLQNSSKYEKCLNQLKVLRKKEERILDNIGNSINYEDFDEYVNSITDELVLNQNKNQAIKQRISYMFEKRAAENNEYFDKDLSYEFCREYYYIKDTCLNFLLKTKGRGKNTPRILKHKYKQAFINRDIETELLYAGYNLNNLVKTPEESKHQLLNMELNIYQLEKAEFYYSFTRDKIQSLIKQSQNLNAEDIDKNEIYNNLAFIKFLLKKVSKEDLAILEIECGSFVEDDNTIILYDDISVVDKLIEYCAKETNKYQNIQKDNSYDEEINQNKYVESLSEQLVDQIFNLIKQSVKTYDIAIKMCLLEINNKINTNDFEMLLNELEQSIKKEQEIVSEIEIADCEKDVVANILDTSIDLIADLNGFKFTNDLEALCDENNLINRNIIVRQRILNLIPDLYTVDDSVYKNSDVPLYIIQNNLIEVMKEFEKNIGEAKDKIPLIVAKYEEIIANDDLTDDFVKAKGKVENMITFDDETLAALLELDLEEYKFDKSELLFNYIILTIEGIFEHPNQNPTPLEMARMEFQGVFINVAADNIQTEIIYENELSEEEVEEIQKIKTKRGR